MTRTSHFAAAAAALFLTLTTFHAAITVPTGQSGPVATSTLA
jgi:hypothetical protein